MKTSTKGTDLIKEFEGCELTAYVCPAGVLTIGYGHTGVDVSPNQTITQEEANNLLVKDLGRFENSVNDYVTVDITQSMFDSLVSFTYNCGADAFRNSTLLRLLNSKDYEGAAGQFDRWVNGANGPLPGLVRRREAEEKLFRAEGFPDGTTQDKPNIVATITATTDTVLKKEPVQSSELSYNQLVKVEQGEQYKLVWQGNSSCGHTKVSLAYGGGNWFIYDDHWKGAKVNPTPVTKGEGVVLDTPYFSQRDNYRDAGRTCFSSSCAMLVETLKPGTLPGDKGDDKYVQTVFSIGDTTEAWVQVKALERYNISASFVQNGNVGLVKSQIDKGIPVPIGILHHGPASAPSGGGHWICVIGYNDKGFVVNDPWGEIDHKTGQYISTDGKRLQYSYNLINARWTVSNPNDGWCIIAK